jgi:hypothetical protein
MVTLHSLLAVGPLPPSVAPDATSLLDLVLDLQSDVLWETGVYEIGEWMDLEPDTDLAA